MADNSAASPETEKAQKGKAQKKVQNLWRVFAFFYRKVFLKTLCYNPLEIKFLPQIL
jgi:hypothetical protein